VADRLQAWRPVEPVWVIRHEASSVQLAGLCPFAKEPSRRSNDAGKSCNRNTCLSRTHGASGASRSAKNSVVCLKKKTTFALRANGRKQIHGREVPIVIVTLTQAIRICQNMGLSKRAIRRLHLSTGMQDDAVRTLAAQHLKLAERRRIPPDKQQHSKDPAK
jgi:hypothetical protein